MVLDYWFNRETRKNTLGETERFHYTWEDHNHSGFIWLGHSFQSFGAQLDSLTTSPNAVNLKGASVYIIVDPDTKKETANPNFVEKEYVEAIKNWVKEGGVLMLMANDTANCEIPHFNQLSKEFGIEFTDKSINMVKNDNYPDGAVKIPANHPIFPNERQVYVKELSV